MSSPFDGDSRALLVLLNSELQYSLWPVETAVPPGWEVCAGPFSHAQCDAYICAHWTDLRPASLRTVRSLEGNDLR